MPTEFIGTLGILWKKGLVGSATPERGPGPQAAAQVGKACFGQVGAIPAGQSSHNGKVAAGLSGRDYYWRGEKVRPGKAGADNRALAP